MQKSAGTITFGLVVVGLLLASCSSSHSPMSDPDRTTTRAPSSRATPGSAADIPPYFESAEAARPFPKLIPASYFRDPVVAHAYRIAGRSPGVVAQQPCLCHCDGHRSLLDCYASEHASNCLICITEALLTEQMTKRGKTAEEIREAIIRGDWRDVQTQ